MKLTTLGHACIFVETPDCRVLMDPVLWDPHQEGLFHIYPAREIVHEELPPLDLLVVTHRHMDHLHIRSLAQLPRDVDVVIPRDPLIEKVLRTLGYRHIHPLAPLESFSIGSTRFLTTPSDARVVEVGLVVADPSGSLWNAVDTWLNFETIARVKQAFGGIDLFLATWQPMLEVEYQWNQSVEFPRERYEKLLQHVAALKPRVTVPGSNGFVYCGPSAWLNRIVFPVPRARFCADVADLLAQEGCAGCEAFAMDPGDRADIDGGRVTVERRASPFVARLHEYGDDRRFSPVDLDGRMQDAPVDGVAPGAVREAIEDELFRALPAALNDAPSDPPSDPFQLHRQLRWTQQIEVVFPAERLVCVIDFSKSPITVTRGASELAADHVYITATALYGILTRTRTWDYAIMGGFYRRFQTRSVADGPPVDPLLHRHSEPLLQEAIVELELEQWKASRPLSAGSGRHQITVHESR